jgi:hypothetical protein
LRFYATPHAFAADAKRSRHAAGAGFVEDLQDFHAGRKDDLHRFNALTVAGSHYLAAKFASRLIIGTVSALIADFKKGAISDLTCGPRRDGWCWPPMRG